jgi:exopolysaccharide biosynthesis polyprenyl glycosylphosphotransferase
MHLILGTYNKLLEQTTLFSFKYILRKLVVSSLGISILLLVIHLMNISINLPYQLCFYVLFFILSFIIENIIWILYKNSKKCRSNVRRIVLIGHSNAGEQYCKEMNKYNCINIHIIGYVHIKKINNYNNIPYLGSLKNMKEIIYTNAIDELVVTRPICYDPLLKNSLSFCENMGLIVTMILDLECKYSQIKKAQVAMVGTLPVLKFHIVSLNESELFIKRVMDIIGALIGMIFFLIALVVITPLIKLESSGPVLFKQKRVGKNGRIFNMFKFRSMVYNAEELKCTLLNDNELSGNMFKINNDPRITKVGNFIRKTSIDELPQFWNVLKGDMSLVGTRPPTIDEFNNYSIHHYKRLAIPPGITGNWQVNGRNNITDFEQVVMLDTEYINNWSILKDIKIIFKTIVVVFMRRGSQ